MRNLRYLAFLLISVVGCHYDEPVTELKNVIAPIIFTANPILADGKSSSTLQVTFPVDIVGNQAPVEFRTTDGTFAESGKDVITVNGDLVDKSSIIQRIAKATLVSSIKVGKAYITARSAGYARSDSIDFVQACPDSLWIIPDKLFFKAAPDSEVKFTVELMRGSGKISLNTLVNMFVIGTDNKKKGMFREYRNRSDENGKCYFTFTLGQDVYTGPLSVQVIVQQNLCTAMKTIQIVATQ